MENNIKTYEIDIKLKDGCNIIRSIDLTDEDVYNTKQELKCLNNLSSFYLESQGEFLVINPTEIRNISIKMI